MRGKGLSEWSIRGALGALSRVLSYAARRGYVADNAVRRLERGERPATVRREQRILGPDEIALLLDAADERHRPLLATAVFTGLRQGELLGLTWADLDLPAGVLRVRCQLSRDGRRTRPKTPQAIRDVIVMPALGRLLREHRLASRWSGDADPLFATVTGSPMSWRNVTQRGLDPALRRASLDDPPRFRFHDCRQTFASLLVAQGADVVFVSRQLGHASPAITLSTYAHLFDHQRHADAARDSLEARYGSLVEGSAWGSTGGATGGNGRELVHLPVPRDAAP